MKVATALRRELRSLPKPVAQSTLAGSALALARMLDDVGTADTARTAAARELRETLAVLRADGAVDEVDRMTKYEQAGLRAVAS